MGLNPYSKASGVSFLVGIVGYIGLVVIHLYLIWLYTRGFGLTPSMTLGHALGSLAFTLMSVGIVVAVSIRRGQ